MSERFGSYEVQALLGKHDPSAVYRGSDGKRSVALKCVADAGIDAGALARLQEAAPALAGLRHASIAGFVEIIVNDKMVCVVSELPEGEPLLARLPAAPDLKLAWTVARDVLDALTHAHSQGIVHGNLKPENLFVDANGKVTVADFASYGLSKHADPTALAFASPEHVDGGEITLRSDLYQVGALVYRIITGRPVFSGSREEIVRQVKAEMPADPSSIAPKVAWQLDWVMKRALAKNPVERFPGAREFLESLRLGFQESLGISLQIPPAPPPVVPRMPPKAAAPAVKPATEAPAPAPKPPLQAAPAPAPKPQPAADAPKPQPAVAAPKPQPAVAAPKPQPAVAAPKSQAAAAAPKPQPAAAPAKPAPPAAAPAAKPQMPAIPVAEWEMELDPELDKLPPAPPPLSTPVKSPAQGAAPAPKPAPVTPPPTPKPAPASPQAAPKPSALSLEPMATPPAPTPDPKPAAPPPAPKPPPPAPAASKPAPTAAASKPAPAASPAAASAKPAQSDALLQKARMLAAAKPASAAGSGEADQNGKVGVLFVDDEERVLNGLRALFRNDYHVYTA